MMLGRKPASPSRRTGSWREAAARGEKASPLGGLSSSQAAELLERHGPNELPEQGRRSGWRMAAEIARELGWPVNSVKSRLHRALRMLRERMEN